MSKIMHPEPVKIDQHRSPQFHSELSEISTLAETAEFLRISKPHLSNIVRGKIRGLPLLQPIRAGRRLLFRRETLQQWIQDVEAMGRAVELPTLGEER